MSNRDNLFADSDCVEKFAFDERVADVFPDMIKRSVPGYVSLVSLTGVIASEFICRNSTVYDLGCSLGAVSSSILANLQVFPEKLYAVDNSSAMLEKCRDNLSGFIEEGNLNIEFLNEDIRTMSIAEASFIALNFTLQFLPPEDRNGMVQKIYDGLIPGGAFVLSEKITLVPEEDDKLIVRLHELFKSANGYSDLEIAAKRSALEKVLIPETAQTHIKRLKNAGFEKVIQWHQTLNFSSFLAVKSK